MRGMCFCGFFDGHAVLTSISGNEDLFPCLKRWFQTSGTTKDAQTDESSEIQIR